MVCARAAFLMYFRKKKENVSYEYDRWVVETQLCKFLYMKCIGCTWTRNTKRTIRSLKKLLLLLFSH